MIAGTPEMLLVDALHLAVVEQGEQLQPAGESPAVARQPLSILVAVLHAGLPGQFCSLARTILTSLPARAFRPHKSGVQIRDCPVSVVLVRKGSPDKVSILPAEKLAGAGAEDL